MLGVCTTLDPEMNPVAIIEPYLERFLLGEKKQWSEIVLEASREMALSALSLPGELQRFMDRAARGEIEFGFRNLDENARLIYHGGQQILWGMLTATAAAALAIRNEASQSAPAASVTASTAATVSPAPETSRTRTGRPGT